MYFKCNEVKIRSCFSPDGKYVLSGSEDGKVSPLFVEVPVCKHICAIILVNAIQCMCRLASGTHKAANDSAPRLGTMVTERWFDA